MTSAINNDNERFDRTAKQLHGVALTQLDPDTLARLRSARHASATSARPTHRAAWWLATACSALLAVGIGLQLRPGPMPSTPATSHEVASQPADGNDYAPLATLDENPDLYMWLGSDNALAME